MAMMELFQVAAKLVLDKSDYDKDMQDADKSGKSLADNLGSYMEKAKNIISGIMGALAIKKVASDIWNLAKETAAAGDRIDKTSQALGFSRQAFQEWDYILAQNGASIDSLGASMRTLQSAISENSGETAAALSQLGLSAAHLQSISPEEQFEQIVKALQKLPDGAKKSQLAMQLLGRNAQSLMPLLNSSAEATEDLRQRAHDLGLVMSDEDIDASVAFGDALDDLTRTWTGLKQKFGAQVLPFLTKGLQTASDALGKISNAVRNAFKTGDWSGVFKTVVDQLKSILHLDQITWPTWDDVRAAATTAWETIKKGLTTVFKFIFGETPDGGIKWPTWDDVKSAAITAWKFIQDGAKEVFKFVFGETEDGGIKWPTATEIWGKIKDGLSALWDGIRTFAKYTLTFFFGENENGGIRWPDPIILWNKIKDGLQALWDSVKENAKTILKLVFGEDEDGGIKWPSGYTIWSKVKEGLEKLWDGIKTMAKTVLKLTFGEDENGGIKWPSKFTLWNKIKEGLGKLWDGIKELAKGTLKFIFGESEDGGIRWKSASVIWGKIKDGLKAMWDEVKGFAKNILKFIFGEDENGGIDFPTGTEVRQKIISGLETLWKGVKTAAKSVLTFLFGEGENGGIEFPSPAEVWSKISHAWDMFWDGGDGKGGIRKYLEDAATWVLQLFGWPEESEQEVVKFFGDWWSMAKEWIQAVATWTLGLFGFTDQSEAVEHFRKWWEGDDGNGGVKAMIKQLANWALGALGLPDVDGIVRQVSTWWNGNGDDDSGVKGLIMSTLDSIFISFGLPKASDIINTITNWWNGIVSKIHLGFSAVMDSITDSTGLFQGGEPSGPSWGEPSIDQPVYVPGWNAKGLNYVPYDGYTLVHRGESILNQNQSREWRQGGGMNYQELYSMVASAVATAVSNIQINMDGKQVGNAVTDQVSKNIYRAQYGRRFTYA